MESRFEGSVVITGASSGIGREMARIVAARAKTLTLVARRRSRLEELRTELVAKYTNLTVDICECDLGDRAATQRLAAEFASRERPIDVLVNNAGLGDMGLFESSDLDKTLSMIEVNVNALVILTRALLPGFIARKRGGVLNVSSGFGISYLPSFTAYVGTKHFVTGFTNALRAETSGTGVTITQVCPGPVATEFEENAGNFTGQKVPSFIEITAEHCARAAVLGFERGAALIVPGLVMKLAIFANGFAPNFLYRFITARLGRVARRLQQSKATEKAALEP